MGVQACLDDIDENRTFLNRIDPDSTGRTFRYPSIPQILLLHVSAVGAEMLDELLTAYAKDGVQFITHDGALHDPAYHEVLDVALTRGDTLYEKVIEARHVSYPPFPLQPLSLLGAFCHEPEYR